MRTLRKAATFSLIALPFGLAFGIAFALLGIQMNTDPLWLDVLFALAYAVTITLIPGIVYLASFRGFPLTVNLPGFQPVVNSRQRHMRFAVASGLISILAVTTVVEPVPLAMRVGLALLMISALSAAGFMAFRDFRSIGPSKSQLSRAVNDFGANGIIYMGRKDGGAYQIEQWLPHLRAAGVTPIIVVRDREAAKALGKAMPHDVPVVLCVSNADLDIVVTSSIRAVFYVNSVASNSIMVNYLHLKHVYLGHGDSDKEISALPVHRMYDKVFVAGQAALDRYAQAGISLDPEQGIVVGRPQLQMIRKNTNTEPEPLKKVLYAPTWSGYNAASSLSSLPVALPFIKDLVGRGITVIFRPHPLSFRITADKAYIKAIDELLQTNGAQHFVSSDATKCSLTDLFNQSDGMLTDISSVIIDYLASEKPLAIIDASRSISLSEYPSAAAAYLTYEPSDPQWIDFLERDSMSSSRRSLAAHYIGHSSGEPFNSTIRTLMGWQN